MQFRAFAAAMSVALFGSSVQAQTLLVPALPDGQVDASAVLNSLIVYQHPDGDRPNLYLGETLEKRFVALFMSPPTKYRSTLSIETDGLPEPVVHLLANALTATHCEKAGLVGINVDWAGTSAPFDGKLFEGGWWVNTSCRDMPQ